MVGQSGLEPPTSRLSVVCSSQLSYWPVSWWSVFCFSMLTSHQENMVEISGIEPLTSCLQGRRSPSWAKPPHPIFTFRGIPSKLNNEKFHKWNFWFDFVKSSFLRSVLTERPELTDHRIRCRYRATQICFAALTICLRCYDFEWYYAPRFARRVIFCTCSP